MKNVGESREGWPLFYFLSHNCQLFADRNLKLAGYVWGPFGFILHCTLLLHTPKYKLPDSKKKSFETGQASLPVGRLGRLEGRLGRICLHEVEMQQKAQICRQLGRQTQYLIIVIKLRLKLNVV